MWILSNEIRNVMNRLTNVGGLYLLKDTFHLTFYWLTINVFIVSEISILRRWWLSRLGTRRNSFHPFGVDGNQIKNSHSIGYQKYFRWRDSGKLIFTQFLWVGISYFMFELHLIADRRRNYKKHSRKLKKMKSNRALHAYDIYWLTQPDIIQMKQLF